MDERMNNFFKRIESDYNEYYNEHMKLGADYCFNNAEPILAVQFMMEEFEQISDDYNLKSETIETFMLSNNVLEKLLEFYYDYIYNDGYFNDEIGVTRQAVSRLIYNLDDYCKEYWSKED